VVTTDCSSSIQKQVTSSKKNKSTISLSENDFLRDEEQTMCAGENLSNSSLKEMTIYQDHYSKLCSTVVDIENLLPYFVPYIIAQSELEEIMVIPSKKYKVVKLLKAISGPLEAGNAKNFYTMLDIFEKHGTQATKELAVTMRSLITTRPIG